MKILTVEQMTEVDRLSTELHEVPSLILMENAGIHLFLALRQVFEDGLRHQRIAIFCGKGNNGGDGLVLARQLVQHGHTPDVFLMGKHQDVQGDAAANLGMCLKTGLAIEEITSEATWTRIAGRMGQYDIMVDALLGTGLTQPLKGLYSRVVRAMNASEAFVLAVDIPSGMFADSAQGGPLCVEADLTVTFTAPKIAHILHPAQESIGELQVVPIGSPPELMDRPEYFLHLLDLESLAAGFPARRIASHKGDYGHVAVIAGSKGKSGAATLSGLAALKSGAGLVTVCSPDVVQDSISSYRPELMTEGLNSSPSGTLARDCLTRLESVLENKDAAGLGPGLGTEEETVELIQRLVETAQLPLVIDADGINAFAGCPEKIVNQAGLPLVLTPHPGEFSRLTGYSAKEISARKIALVREFATRQEVWLVLKDFRTLVAEPSGQVYVSPNGNPGMATAGMGDVLTGVLTALIGLFFCRGLTSSEEITQAVSAGVYLHSLAGDLAVLKTGMEALTSGSVIDHLDQAFAAFHELDG